MSATAPSAIASEAQGSAAVKRDDGGAPTNPRGIPYAPFVDKVEDYVTSRAEVESTLRSFQEMISNAGRSNLRKIMERKYQFMEANTQRRLTGLREKAPDIQKTLDMVQFLQTRDESSPPLQTTFELNDTLHAHATVPTPASPEEQEVYLWLGANTMLAYPLPAAAALLSEKLAQAKQKIDECTEDADFLREQITTMEVATARVYNWDVGMKRREKESESDGGGGAGDAGAKG